VRMDCPDRHLEIELIFLESGRLTYLFGGERISISSGRVALFWGAVPHQIVDFEDLESFFVVTIPLPWILSWDMPEQLTTRILNGQVLQETGAARAVHDEHLFEQWFQDFHRNSTSDAIVLLEVRARLLRLARNLKDGQVVSSHFSPVRHSRRAAGTQDFCRVEGMARFIAQNYIKRICLSDIAAAVGLHPDYAAYTFKKTFGITLNNFVILHRVQCAQRLLVTSHQKIIEIALESGFNSLSRFNTCFKRHCQCTPREYRNLHRL